MKSYEPVDLGKEIHGQLYVHGRNRLIGRLNNQVDSHACNRIGNQLYIQLYTQLSIQLHNHLIK